MDDGEKPSLEKVSIRKLPTGVPGLDQILGGGLPEFSFNIIAGNPGCGKTTLAHQILFANATPEHPALYFTILGEPAVKMLRYQQQYTFFDHSVVDGAIRFINLSHIVLNENLGAVLAAIIEEVEASHARFVVVDSFRTVVRRAHVDPNDIELQVFIQRLSLYLTSWQVTSFLIGEYAEVELRDNPVFTVADGLIWLYQVTDRNSTVRKLHVMKMRGQDNPPGLHTFRITDSGVHAFPRTFGLDPTVGRTRGPRRISTGIAGLDALMGGGLLEGSHLLVSGPSGAGKTVFGSHFIAEGARHGESAVIAVFEELPEQYISRAARLGIDLRAAQDEGRLKFISIRPLDLTVDETVYALVDAVREMRATRLVIDSLTGFEMALAPDLRSEFRESLYRMIGALTRLGVTTVSTVEIEENFTSMALSNFAVSFLADDIVRLRYVSIKGQLRKMLVVVKMRGSAHSIDLWEFDITPQGLVLGDRLRGYYALTSGIPQPWSSDHEPEPPEAPPARPSASAPNARGDPHE